MPVRSGVRVFPARASRQLASGHWQCEQTGSGIKQQILTGVVYCV